MPMYDLGCQTCGFERPDVYQQIQCEQPPCPRCAKPLERVWTQHNRGGVIDDSIPGGQTVDVPFGYRDGKLQKFYSKSEIAKAAKQAGYEPYVRHDPADRGKSKHTSRWV